MNYIGYYRVSTKKQGESGLSLEDQKNTVVSYIKSIGGNVLSEFTEIESGGKVDREILQNAINVAKAMNASIVVKRIDRLTRDGFKISTLLEELGINYIDCESPNDSNFVKHIKLAVAKEEKDKIGSRITNALGVIKEEIDRNGHYVSRAGNIITSLGNVENLGGDLAVERSKKVRQEKALLNPNNVRAKAVIRLMKKEGYSFYAIAKFLNENEFRTSRNNLFSQQQVKNLYKKWN